MSSILPDPATGSGATREPSDVSVGQLMGDISNDLSTLVRQELDLAKAELKQEAAKAVPAAGMLGGAGFAGYMTILFLSITVWMALSNLIDPAWAALIVTIVWGIVGAVLFVRGRQRMKQVHPIPERTVETVKQTPAAFKTPSGPSH
jgi:hypothetical protein